MEHPLLDVLIHRSYPELARALRARIPRIVERWAVLARQSIQGADELTFAQLRDDLPVVLEQQARALAADRAEPTEKLLEMTPRHGETRFHQNFNLNELLADYQLLRPVVIEELSAELGRTLAPEEEVALHAVLDLAVRQGISAFVEHQTRQLKAATEAQSKYLSFLSHDLRGGLNGISLMVEVLRRELVKEPKFAESLDDLEMMRRQIFETVNTMDRFLHAERFRKGKVQVKPGRVDLDHLIAEVATQFSYQAKEKKLDLNVDRGQRCQAVSDRELLSIILQNLLSNALKYTQHGSVRVWARPGGRNGEAGGCTVAVADQGPGIPKEKLSELFGSFTRGDTHGQPGVGLGLSIARQTADLLGARLWAESEVGKGSTFYLQLPKEPPRTESKPTP